jgi:hypothetical protein
MEAGWYGYVALPHVVGHNSLLKVQARLRSQSMLPSYHDLAVLDATKPSLQFISTSMDGHRMIDLLVGSLLTVGIVHTRMAKLGRAANARFKVPINGSKYM